MNFFQKIAIKLIVPNQDKLIKWAIAYLMELYKSSRNDLQEMVWDAAKQSPLSKTATQKETNELMFAVEEVLLSKEVQRLVKAWDAVTKA